MKHDELWPATIEYFDKLLLKSRARMMTQRNRLFGYFSYCFVQ